LAEKTYFWLKLKTDFFSEKAIKKLRKIAGGDTYTVIYLEMLLLSLKNNGKLYFDCIEDNFHEELALDLDEDPDNVLFTVTFLEKCGLLEKTSDFEFDLLATPEMVGKETSGAERTRRCRERERTQKALQCHADVTNCNTEIEIEKDLEKELETEKKKSKKQPVVAKVYYETDPELDQEFKYFLETRKSIKATNSEHAIDLLIKKLETLSTDTSGFNRETALETIRQSTLNSWKGLFPLKEQKAEQKKGRLDWIDDL